MILLLSFQTYPCLVLSVSSNTMRTESIDIILCVINDEGLRREDLSDGHGQIRSVLSVLIALNLRAMRPQQTEGELLIKIYPKMVEISCNLEF